MCFIVSLPVCNAFLVLSYPPSLLMKTHMLSKLCEKAIIFLLGMDNQRQVSDSSPWISQYLEDSQQAILVRV